MQLMANSGVCASAPTRRQAIIGAAVTVAGLIFAPVVMSAEDDGISHSAESIHQEPIFHASPKRIYDVLTDPTQFHKVTLLSEAMHSGMMPGMKPTQISTEPGSNFLLFGGHITGRQIELVQNLRIVQAWRAGSWDPGTYSVVRFDLSDQGSGTKIVFDHTGFPVGQARHLAEGWKNNYWLPLGKFLEQTSPS